MTSDIRHLRYLERFGSSNNAGSPQYRSRRRLLLALAVLGCLWAGAVVVLGPRIAAAAEYALHGETLPLLGQIMTRTRVSHQSLERYLRAFTDANLITLLLPWAVVMVVTWWLTSRRFFARYVGEATPESLAVIRIVCCAVLLGMTLMEDLGATAILPGELIRRYGVLKLFYLLPGFEDFLRSAAALRIFQGITAGLLLLGALGWRTRAVIPLAAVCYLLLGGIVRQYGFYFHTGIIPLYAIAVLCFTPCGDGWSLDRLRRERRGSVRLRQAAVYGWARYACWMAIALPYLFAGLSKLRNGGLLWWTSDNIRSIFYACTLQPLNYSWQTSLYLHAAPDIFFSALGLIALVTELAFATVLFSRTARLLFPILMMLCQVGIIFVQNILFVDLLMLTAFFSDGDFRRATKSWLAAVRGWWVGHRTQLAHAATKTVSLAATPPYLLRPAAAVAGLACLLLTCWLWRVEIYPLTAMQMFSQVDNPGVIDYYKVFTHRESGDVARISLTNVLGSEADFRYRYHLQRAFDSPNAHITTLYLAVGGAILNRDAPPGNKVTQIEVQHWRWDFRAQPQSSTYGQQVGSFVVKLDEAELSDREKLTLSRDH